MNVRQLGVKELDAYRDIRLEALKTFPEAYGTSYGEAEVRPLKTYADMLENSVILGAFADDSLCGIACFHGETGRHDKHIGHLYQMYVRPAQQGNGLGLALIEALLSYAKTRVEQIYLGVGTNNLAALALYKKAGFEIYGTEPRALCVDGQYIDEHLMVKFLDQKDA